MSSVQPAPDTPALGEIVVYRVAEVAEILKIHPKTVTRAIASKQLVASRLATRGWRIEETEMLAWWNRCRNVEPDQAGAQPAADEIQTYTPGGRLPLPARRDRRR